jgi:hypothetical protein
MTQSRVESPKPFSPTSSFPCSTEFRFDPAAIEHPDEDRPTSRSIALSLKSKSECHRGIVGQQHRPEPSLPIRQKSSHPDGITTTTIIIDHRKSKTV